MLATLCLKHWGKDVYQITVGFHQHGTSERSQWLFDKMKITNVPNRTAISCQLCCSYR